MLDSVLLSDAHAEIVAEYSKHGKMQSQVTV